MATTPPSPDLWDQYAGLAAHYYMSARFAALSGYVPVCGNLIHHALEYLLKCGVIKSGAVPGGPKAPFWVRLQIGFLRTIASYGVIQPPRVTEEVDTFLRRRFGHRLKKLWKAFKRAHPSYTVTQFDSVISGLDRWEEIRYPSRGTAMTVALVSTTSPLPPPSGPGMCGVRTYELNVEDLDRCFQELWSIISLNPIWFKILINAESKPMAASVYGETNLHRIYS